MAWSELPDDVLRLIVARLPLSCHPSFAAVCRSWGRVVSPVFPMDHCPLLTYYEKQSSNCLHYFDPSRSLTFVADCPLDLSKCKLVTARDGWLLLQKKNEFIFLNPSTRSSHYPPPLDSHYGFWNVAFCGDPSSDYMIFAMDAYKDEFVDITICSNNEWSLPRYYDNNIPFAPSMCSNPVYYNGSFYCLGVRGNLGAYDPTKGEWRVLEKPRDIDIRCDESYLVGSEGGLVTVLFRKNRTQAHVLKLNQGKMEWEEAQGIGCQAFFLGRKMSVLTALSGKKMQGKFYVPSCNAPTRFIRAQVKIYEGRAFLVSDNNMQEEGEEEEKENSSLCNCFFDCKCCVLKEPFCSVWLVLKSEISCID